MASVIHDFCDERKIPYNIESAFNAYVKTVLSSSLAIHPGDTLSKIVDNLTREKVDDLWLKFVLDFKQILTPSLS